MIHTSLINADDSIIIINNTYKKNYLVLIVNLLNKV